MSAMSYKRLMKTKDNASTSKNCESIRSNNIEQSGCNQDNNGGNREVRDKQMDGYILSQQIQTAMRNDENNSKRKNCLQQKIKD